MCSSVPFSRSVLPDSLQPNELQHARPPCPSPTPRVHPNPCPLSQWCHPAISSSVIPFSSCPQPLPASGYFQMSQLFAWGGQSIGVSASTSVLPNEHPGLISFRMDCLDLLAGQGTLKNLLQHHSSKPSILRHSAFFTVQLSQPDMTTGKTIALTRRTIVDKVMSLLFNMLSRLVIIFLPKSKQVSFNFMAASTICSDFGAQKNKVSHCFHCFPIYLPWTDGTGCHLVSACHSPFIFIKRLFSSSSLSVIRVVSSAYLRLLIFLPAVLIPAGASSSPAFLMMYSAYKLNKQGDNIQPWHIPFLIWK